MHPWEWDMQYHTCIPGVGVLGTRAGPGILPDILTEACMNDLEYPIVLEFTRYLLGIFARYLRLTQLYSCSTQLDLAPTRPTRQLVYPG